MSGTKSWRLTLSTMFGVTIFILKTISPFPFDKFFIAPQAILLALGSLLLGVPGATFVSFVSGSLTAILRFSEAPTIFLFSLIYGALVDVLVICFKAKPSIGYVKLNRMIASLALSSILVGVLSYCSAVLIKIVPFRFNLLLTTLFASLLNGALAGYITTYIWRKKLRYLS